MRNGPHCLVHKLFVESVEIRDYEPEGPACIESDVCLT